ncbi:hypothetical protein K450DRAFT_237978 [Umbelopsis ramanniana AG]|uniref:DUF1746 domain-containing protein n=1 Tax=Umbelopsis ramanniana AG TaxID=1314678 RepID=A0AAD5HDL4_UMBRA|nr:uncharacterized protein K450DRAFT_237978 [Umbelopsis ramanniana AG]KAI8580322.1 hypothetical protein K450DRAFT_237978 [Umbelopsis ramanniana AG]
MGLYAKRDVIRSLDFLLYCQFAYIYLLDASLLVLLFRILIQLFLSPRSIARTLRTALGIALGGFILCLLLHATSEPAQYGLLIDFVGRVYKPSKLRLIVLDFIILCFQVILIFTSSSLTSALLQRVTTTAANVAAAAGNDTSSSNHERIEEESAEIQEPPIGYEHELVVDVNLRASIRNVFYAEMDITQLREQRERTLLV